MSKYNVGVSNVGSYLVSGQPHISQLILTTDTNESQRVSFASVTKTVIVRSTYTSSIRVHFAPYTASFDYSSAASTANNFVTLSGSGQIELDVKCKEVFISSPDAAGNEVVEIYGELTNIPGERMFSLDGVTGVSS